jgi:hypothetical protein
MQHTVLARSNSLFYIANSPSDTWIEEFQIILAQSRIKLYRVLLSTCYTHTQYIPDNF